MMQLEKNRRPITTRNTDFAQRTTQWLFERGFKPNQISILSIVFALLAGVCLGGSQYLQHSFYILTMAFAIMFILLRLLCNLFDGMLAIEKGAASKSGDIYNDFPDRPADIVILLGVGYASHSFYGIQLGWLAALLAVMTAYVRLLGAASGAKQCFAGPMAKQQRMAVIIFACVSSAVLSPFVDTGKIFSLALVFIIIGSLLTIYNRLKKIIPEIENIGGEC
jgi:phosphatidylglycerophosphate synthase